IRRPASGRGGCASWVWVEGVSHGMREYRDMGVAGLVPPGVERGAGSTVPEREPKKGRASKALPALPNKTTMIGSKDSQPTRGKKRLTLHWRAPDSRVADKLVIFST